MANESVPPPHASLRRRRHPRSLASLLCPQPPAFLRLDSLARYAVATFTGLAAAVEAATPVALSAAVASAWYAGKGGSFSFFRFFFSLFSLSLLSLSSFPLFPHQGNGNNGKTTLKTQNAGQVDEIPVPMPGYTLRLRPAPSRLSGALRLLLVAAACSLAARVRNAVREEAFRRGRLRLTREGLRNVYGSDGRLRSTLLLSPFKVGGSGGGGGAAGAAGAASASRGEGENAPPSSSSSSPNSMTLVDMVEGLFEAVIGDSAKNDAKNKRPVGVDVADDLRRVCEAVGLPFRPEVEGANVQSLRAAAVRCREEVFGKGK